jgi:hypothetical protein
VEVLLVVRVVNIVEVLLVVRVVKLMEALLGVRVEQPAVLPLSLPL